MTYFLTEKDLIIEGDNTVYVGDLGFAKKFIREYASIRVDSQPGQYTVLICQDGAEPDWENCNEWGKSTESEDEAWRYALGAAFGPLDGEFQPFPLTTNKREAVAAWVHYKFPERLDAFYSRESDYAVVQDNMGHLWFVWPTGETKEFWER